MAKKKSSAQVFVPGASGRMVLVEDHRFDQGSWPIQLEVPATDADLWMQYLQAECDERGWNHSSIGQMAADENSGSITVQGGPYAVTIVWERQRKGPLTLRAKSEPETEGEQAANFVRRINERFRARETREFYRRTYLYYERLPWRGELWLDDRLRLGPPSHHAKWLLAPQVIVVDATVNGVSWQGADSLFAAKMDAVALFLGVVMRCEVTPPHGGYAWTIDPMKPEPELRQLGYIEQNVSTEMPRPGQHPQVPLHHVDRPDFAFRGIMSDETEQSLPADVHDLWQRYVNLPAERQEQFRRAARAYQLGLSLWRQHRTASLAFRVVACEALKPPGRKYDRWNVYDVVEGLLGTSYAEPLRQLAFPPQKIRSFHLHRGALLGAEGVHQMMIATFHDPTFDEDYRVVAQATHAAMIEWLRAGGACPVPVRRFSARSRENARDKRRRR